MSRLRSRINVMEELKYCILPVEIVFGLNLVSRYCSEFQIFVIYFCTYVISLFLCNVNITNVFMYSFVPVP
jgi:hypothetical protein